MQQMDLVFVNKIPVRITEDVQVLEAKEQYTNFLDSNPNGIKQAVGNLLIKANTKNFDQLLIAIQQEASSRLQKVTIWVEDHHSIQQLMQQRLKLIKAAGGVVYKGNQTLMIYRLGKWDLPKGKLEKGEKSAVAAVREVEEECNIKVQLLSKLGATWHIYVKKKNRILKKTIWYTMTCLDDTSMKPQIEEGIEKIRWMYAHEIQEALHNSHQSIQYIFRKDYPYFTNANCM